MTYLLDTNVISEMRRASRMHPGAAQWLGSIAPTQLYISTITIFEIAHGAEKVAKRDARRGALLFEWLRLHVITVFEGRILSLGVDAALLAATMHSARARIDPDRLVAAIAKAHGKVIVTRNSKDFAGLGVLGVDPFAG